MAHRFKKPIVRPEQSNDWLQRYEKGETPPKIAETDGFDVRTVRRHIEQAKQEREIHEARAIVLRNALERHFDDIVKFASKTDADITREEPLSNLLRQDRILSALKQHLPRSPLWAYLARWDILLKDLVEKQNATRARIIETLKTHPGLKPVSDAGETLVIPGIAEALAFQMKSWPRGSRGLILKDDVHIEQAEGRSVNIRYGAYNMGRVDKGHVAIIKKKLAVIESEIPGWQEYADLQKLFGELEHLKVNLQDELAVITLRRVVPGRCRYCPI